MALFGFLIPFRSLLLEGKSYKMKSESNKPCLLVLFHLLKISVEAGKNVRHYSGDLTAYGKPFLPDQL